MSPEASNSRPTISPPPARRCLCGHLIMLLIIFSAGALIGAGLLYIHKTKPFPRPRKSVEEMIDKLTRNIADELNLDAEQAEKLRPIIEGRIRAVHELRKVIEPQMKREAKILHDDLAALLNEEQAAKWEELYGQLEAKWFPEEEQEPATQPTTPPATE